MQRSQVESVLHAYYSVRKLVEMEECCLCSRSVEIGGSKKKRKRLYGSACSVSRGVWRSLQINLVVLAARSSQR